MALFAGGGEDELRDGQVGALAEDQRHLPTVDSAPPHCSLGGAHFPRHVHMIFLRIRFLDLGVYPGEPN